MIGETVQHLVYKPETKDADGYRIPGGYAAPVEIRGVGVDTPQSTEIYPNGTTLELAETAITLFLPPGFTCSSHDRFKVRGKLYDVIGSGIELNNMFTGRKWRTELHLKRIAGID